MSIVHLKTRKQRIALNKKATEVKKILWTVDGHEIEVLEKPENEINCFSTTEHTGVFFDGKEVLGPGRMGSRVGFIMNNVHYQVISWGFRFTGVKESKGGKFLLLVDGWEMESRTPINRFFRSLYIKVLTQGAMLLALSMVGVLAILFAHNKIVSSWVARIFLILLPLGLYYVYVGLIGVLKYHSRVFLDEQGDPWWPAIVESDTETGENYGTTATSGDGDVAVAVDDTLDSPESSSAAAPPEAPHAPSSLLIN
eukprot:m.105745 g.105745  ORF g.105745 m.105745 type:complete len:254 (+) comp21048_c0_seq1:279-1040(+)